jgi:hypothetical protein
MRRKTKLKQQTANVKRGQATFSPTVSRGLAAFCFLKKLPVPVTGGRKSSQSPPPADSLWLQT